MGIGATMFLLAIAGQSPFGGTTGYTGGSASEDLIPVCIATTLDPNSYRADPEDANKSRDFLQQLESRFSHGVADDLIEEDNKRRHLTNVAPRFLFQPYSASAAQDIGIPVDCGKDNIRLTVTTRYLTATRMWRLSIIVQVRQKTRILRYSGLDEFGDCREMRMKDSFGGMFPAVWAHRAELFDAIWGDEKWRVNWSAR